MFTAAEIRKRFLDYFARQGHEVVSSSPLVPRDDPTLYFTNAGMVQFKKLFLGQEKRGYSRATTSQKCLRISGKHNDLENVGRTARHHTFFEMLGNFSFGDYFKADAIRYAWEFITVDLGLPKDRLYVTVYTDDDEAHGLWQTVAGVDASRIFRLGEKDNFWSMGDTGPCGPCSEIYVDQGEHMTCGPDCGIGRCDCDRFLEIWNLVFMQYDQIEPGKRVPLPRPSIDTGMGLERIAAVCQGKFSNFECDLFQDLIGYIGEIAGVPYKSRDEESDVALRVIADHARSAAFLITDGVMPSNEGRSYELRRIIRRALRFGTLIGFKDPFLFKVCGKVAEVMGEAFPELVENQAFMTKVVREEEERFARTLGKGLDILAEELARLKKAAATVVPGDVCFKLYDTFGFPIDIVRDVAEKQGFSVDEPGFKVCMDQQKARARDAWKGSGEQDLGGRFAALLETGVTSVFTGYEELKTEAKLLAVLNDKGEPVEKLPQGQGGYVVAARTPFYAESGGQAGDTGVIESLSGAADVLDTLKPAPELHVHKVFVSEGDLTRGQEATLTVNTAERLATARNHTATHLLHAALRAVLGEHVKQAGSLVGPDRLRFDFTHITAMTQDEIAEVEARVNEAILAAIPVSCEVMAVDKALEHGATALFGEKYGAEVRVVAVPGVSKELCGGTHLENTGQAGPFMILSESGVAAGVRRIEGATGLNSLGELARLRAEAAQAASLLKARPGELAERIGGLQKEIKALQKEREQLQAKLLSGAGKSLMDDVREIGGVKLLTVDAPGMPVKALREQMDDIRSKMPSGVAALAAAQDDGKVSLILYVSKDLHPRFTAQSLIKDVSAKIGGSGGGRPDMAQAGGTDAAGIPAAFALLEELIGK